MKKIIALMVCLSAFLCSEAKFLSVQRNTSYKGKVRKITTVRIDFYRNPNRPDTSIKTELFDGGKLVEKRTLLSMGVSGGEKYVYNEKDQLIKVLNGETAQVTDSYAYDDQGHLIAEYSLPNDSLAIYVIRNKFDADGNMIESCGKNSAETVPYCVSSLFNNKGQRIQMNASATRYSGPSVTYYKYDAAGNAIEVIQKSSEHKSHKTIYKYSNNGATIAAEDYIDGKRGLTSKELNTEPDKEGNFLKTTYYSDGKVNGIHIRTIEYY